MEFIRNVCILAHVDHGKTSIADNLLYSNGIISKHSAGDLRHLDSTQDEQERGITMKSSCISLMHVYTNKLKENSESRNYIINLIDSPGHVDFSGEVSTAVKISDNAFIVVDVVEGVSSQTRTVIQQAWKERLNFILVLNKVDKLCLELKLDTTAAYNKLEEIIQAVHHIIGELISIDIREQEDRTDSIITEEEISRNYDTSPFNPLKGKVVFCSAFHQWGFKVADFVLRYSEQLGIDKVELYKKMWGDFYINSKRKICKGAQAENRKNVFSSLVLDPIWSVYRALEADAIDEVSRMMSKLNLRVEIRKACKNKNRDGTVDVDNIRSVFSQWLPLPTALLDALVERCPNPRDAITDQKLNLLVPDDRFQGTRDILKQAAVDNGAPSVAFVSKFFFESNSSTDLIGLARIYSGQVKPGMKIFAFSNEFDPRDVPGDLLVLTPNDLPEGPVDLRQGGIKSNKKIDYNSDEEGDIDDNTCNDCHGDDNGDPDDNNNQDDRKQIVSFVTDAEKINKPSSIFVARVNGVHQFMGYDHIQLPNGAHAGHVVGLTGLSSEQALRNLTVIGNCCLGDCLGAFSRRGGSRCLLNQESANIICVSVEPRRVQFLNELHDSCSLLERADPSVRVSLAPTGELLIYAAGEIHLQKCLNELSTRIAPHIELDVSAPIVPFRETVTHRAYGNPELGDKIKSMSEELKLLELSCVLTSGNAPRDRCHGQQGVEDSVVVFIRPALRTGTKFCCRVSVHSLPDSLAEWVEAGARLKSLPTALETASEQEQSICTGTRVTAIDYRLLVNRLWTTGAGVDTQGNLLFSYVGKAGFLTIDNPDSIDLYSHAILKGFHRALLAGPICQEQLKNTVFILHDVWEESIDTSNINGIDLAPSSGTQEMDPVFSDLQCNPGQMKYLVTKACQVAMMLHPGIRLMVAEYQLDLEVRVNTFKNLSSLINQMHGQIVNQELVVGNFVVEARVPVVESFGFADKLRKKTSGEVGLPQFKSVQWTILNCPPLLDTNLFKVIEDEAEDCDIGISTELVARTQKYINSVRQRKGIQVRQQLVESGSKQRTLNKKK